MSLSRAFALFVALGVVGLAAPFARAQSSPPNLLQFQARVADAGGTPLAGPVTVEVRIYDVPSGGIPLWSEIHSATALNGVVNLLLGSISVPPLSLFDGTARYLAVRVGADPEMTPRRQIAAIPFARRAAGVAALDASTSIPVGLVTSAHILDGTIATADLANGAVDAVKLGSNAVTTTSILDGTIATADLANSAVTSAKLAAAAVALANIASNSVDSARIVDASILAADLAVGAVTSAAILDGTITTVDLANGAIDATKLGANSVSSATILDGTIATADLANGSVTSAKLAAGAVALANIANNSVDSARIVDGSITLADLATPFATSSSSPALSITGAGPGTTAGVLYVGATSLSGENFGVNSSTASAGSGLQAVNSSTINYADGVRAFINSDLGYGVWAVSSNAVGGMGVVASTDGVGGIGVTGHAFAGAGASYGVYGDTYAPAASGVAGLAQSASGTGSGVSGESQSPDGTGVLGKNYAATGAGTGVSGVTNGSSGRGVSGISNASGATYGVFGMTWGTSGSRAVYAQANANVGIADALVGSVASPSGYAVWSLGTLVCSGSKNFAQPHPTNPSQEIHFACLEGNESGTYFRGRAKIVGGVATIDVPQEFRLTSEATDLTVQCTPLGKFAQLFVESQDLDRIVVRGSADCEFAFFVNGIRRGYAEYEAFHANRSFVPEVRGVPFGTQYTEAVRKILVENGTLNADFTPNEETASKLGWTLRDPEEVKAELQRVSNPQRIEPPARRGGK